MYSHWRLFPMALVGHHRPVKKRRNNVLAQTYYWGICAYTVYAYMCVWMPIYAFSADANYLTVYFGSLISELYCNMVTFMLVVMFRPLVFVADSLLRLAQSGSNNIVHVKETMWSIYEIIHICTAVVDEVKSDHRSKFSNLSNMNSINWPRSQCVAS